MDQNQCQTNTHISCIMKDEVDKEEQMKILRNRCEERWDEFLDKIRPLGRIEEGKITVRLNRSRTTLARRLLKDIKKAIIQQKKKRDKKFIEKSKEGLAEILKETYAFMGIEQNLFEDKKEFERHLYCYAFKNALFKDPDKVFGHLYFDVDQKQTKNIGKIPKNFTEIQMKDNINCVLLNGFAFINDCIFDKHKLITVYSKEDAYYCTYIEPQNLFTNQ